MFANSTLLNPYKRAVTSTLIALLTACTSVPMDRNVARAGGFFEQDENTDPRIRRFDRPAEATIGTLRIAGNNVYLNDRRVEAETKIKNDSHLRTGSGSQARIDFESGSRARCAIGIMGLRIGRSYSDTAECRHQLDMPQGDGHTDMSTVYHVAVDSELSEITVIRGRMEAWLKSDPARRVSVRSAEEIILTPSEIIGPRPVTGADIKRRTDWRNKLKFYEKTPNFKLLGAIGAVVGAAVGAAILMDDDDDDDKQLPPRGTTPPQSTTPSSTDGTVLRSRIPLTPRVLQPAPTPSSSPSPIR